MLDPVSLILGLLGVAGSAVGTYYANKKTSTPAQTKQVNPYNPQQSKVQQQALDQIMKLLEQQGINLGQQSGTQGKFDFAPIAAEQTADYYQNVVPTLSERFTAFAPGAESAQNSSAFRSAIYGSGANLKRGLASLQQQYGLEQQKLGQNQQSINNTHIANLLQAALRPQDTLYSPRQPGIAEQALPGIAAGAGQALGGYATGRALKELTPTDATTCPNGVCPNKPK